MKRLKPHHLFSARAYPAWVGFLISIGFSTFFMPLHAETNPQFGRLFSKPAERYNLNILRQNQKLKTITTQETKEATETVAPIDTAEPIAPITMQGYVKRSDGASTLWINKKAVQENSTANNLNIGQLNERGFSRKGLSTEGVDVLIPAKGKHIRLKAGQMYEPETNQILEMQLVEKAKRIRLEQSGVIEQTTSGDESLLNKHSD